MVSLKHILWVSSAILLAASTATAEPGDGLRAGKLKLSPGLSLSTAFDSNVFFTSDAVEEGTLSSPSIKVQPFINMSTLDPDMVNFNLNAAVGWRQYLRSSVEEIREQSGLDANVDLSLGFNQEGAVSFVLENNFSRTNEPPTDISVSSFDRTLNQAGATIGFHPGGKVFQHYLSYDFGIRLHDDFPDIDRHTHDFTLHNHWRFLPRTAVVLNGDLSLIRYDEPVRVRGDRTFDNVNSNPLRITGGLRGLITKRLSVQLIGGWGKGFYASGSDFSGVLLDTRLTYAFGRISENSNVYLGYERAFQDVNIAQFATHHRPYIGYMQGVADRRLRLTARGDFFIRTYEDVPAGLYQVTETQLSIPADLNDTLLRIRLGGDFDIQKWFTVGVSYSLSANFTDDRVFASGAADDALREYIRHFVGFNLTLRY